MLKNCATVICIACLTACVSNQTPPPAAGAATAATPHPTLHSGIDLQYVDSSVRPQDDIYQYLNGKWLRNYQLPPDKPLLGSVTIVQDKPADFYASYMNEEQLAALSLKPLLAEFAGIDAIKDMNAIPGAMAHLIEIGAGAPFNLQVNLDSRNSTLNAVILSQGG